MQDDEEGRGFETMELNRKDLVFGNKIKWKSDEAIDRGASAEVFKAFDVERGRIFAVKRFYEKASNSQEQKDFLVCS